LTVTQSDVRRATQDLSLSGRPLCVHSSLRSFGWVQGGADAVINALLAEGCTVLVPTMTWELMSAHRFISGRHATVGTTMLGTANMRVSLRAVPI
jgi:aminoglycoside N3'-acetyltransferase